MTPQQLQILSRDDKQGRAIWFLGALSLIKVSSEETHGTLSVVEDLLPAGRATPYHVHRHDDETFHLLAGEVTFYSGTQKFRGTAGTTVFLPRDIPHGFRADTVARILVVTTPGGFDRFVAEAGEPAQSLTIPPPSALDFQKLMPLATKYGMEILGPLPE